MTEDDEKSRSERIKEVRQPLQDPGPPDITERFEPTSPVLENTNSHVTTLLSETSTVDKVLVCPDCSVWFDYKVDWSYCPRCGEEIQEATKDD